MNNMLEAQPSRLIKNIHLEEKNDPECQKLTNHSMDVVALCKILPKTVIRVNCQHKY